MVWKATLRRWHLRDLNDGKAPVGGRFVIRVSWAERTAHAKSEARKGSLGSRMGRRRV